MPFFRLFVVVLPVLLSACSPLYVLKSAKGEAGLLWRRRDIASASADPKTPKPLREKLRLVMAAREFAFSRLGLRRSRDYATYSPVRGPVTFVVSGCARTSFTPYRWWFPFLGTVPYKGYFRKEDALREMRRLQSRGWDSRVAGAAAYNTPLWFSDPLPSSALDRPPGLLAELVIHELAHETVWYKDRVEFNEGVASFVGRRGAQEFLAWKFGQASSELSEYRFGLERDDAFGAVMEELYGKLDELYRGGLPGTEKLARRREIFDWGLRRVERLGESLSEPLNNAVVLSYRLYDGDDELFAALLERHKGDWPAFLEALRGLDRKDPAADLRGRLKPARVPSGR